jgi:hypothetical protein
LSLNKYHVNESGNCKFAQNREYGKAKVKARVLPSEEIKEVRICKLDAETEIKF